MFMVAANATKPEQLLDKSIDRMRQSLNRLAIISPELPPPR